MFPKEGLVFYRTTEERRVGTGDHEDEDEDGGGQDGTMSRTQLPRSLCANLSKKGGQMFTFMSEVQF